MTVARNQTIENNAFNVFARRLRTEGKCMMENEGITRDVDENKGTVLSLLGITQDV
jgi:hypothetical protein